MGFDISTLVVDRTQEDVAWVQELAAKIRAGTASNEELAEWNGAAMKGAYNHTDLNRVGAAMQYIAERLARFGYVVTVAPVVDWMELDTPSAADMALYLSNLAVLRKTFVVMQSTPEVPSDTETLTYREANDIEKILEDIDLLLTRASQAWYYSGDIFLGEG